MKIARQREGPKAFGEKPEKPQHVLRRKNVPPYMTQRRKENSTTRNTQIKLSYSKLDLCLVFIQYSKQQEKCGIKTNNRTILTMNIHCTVHYFLHCTFGFHCYKAYKCSFFEQLVQTVLYKMKEPRILYTYILYCISVLSQYAV